MAEAQNVEGQHNIPQLLQTIADYEKKLQQKDSEIDGYKTRLGRMEPIAAQVQNLTNQRAKDALEVDCLKTESEQTLTKAKNIIFERTKVIKNQELQIEALSQQIESLKEVVRITKDLLEIRNLEVKQLENKINCMDQRMKGEKERQDLLHKKLETMIRHNGELKREYETQLCLFAALRERYNERELARDVIDDMRTEIRTEREQKQNAAAAPAVTTGSDPATVTDNVEGAVAGVNVTDIVDGATAVVNVTDIVDGATSVSDNAAVVDNVTSVEEIKGVKNVTYASIVGKVTGTAESNTSSADSVTSVSDIVKDVADSIAAVTENVVATAEQVTVAAEHATGAPSNIDGVKGGADAVGEPVTASGDASSVSGVPVTNTKVVDIARGIPDKTKDKPSSIPQNNK